MGLLERFRKTKAIDPVEVLEGNKHEIPEYSVKTPGPGLPTWAVSLFSVLFMLAIIGGVFLGAKYVYNSITKDDKPAGTAEVKKDTVSQQGAGGSTTKSSDKKKPSKSKPTGSQLPDTSDHSATPADFGY